MAQDEIAIWEGVITLDKEKKKVIEVGSLRARIDFLKKTVEKHGLKITKIPSTIRLATNFGELDEHEAFYKIYSKFVHPSSILVNKPENINLDVFFSIITMNSQKYALDTVNRISKVSGIPLPKKSDE